MQSENLLSISTGVQASDDTRRNLLARYKPGKEKAETFIKDRILSNKVPFVDPITKLKTNTFTTQITTKKVKVGDKEMTIKADRSFFCKLVFIAQTRNLNLFKVYSHELGPIPWAITTPLGTRLKPNKAKMLEILEKDIPSVPQPQGAAWVIDVFAAIQTLKPIPVNPQTFSRVSESILRLICTVATRQPQRIYRLCDRHLQARPRGHHSYS